MSIPELIHLPLHNILELPNLRLICGALPPLLLNFRPEELYLLIVLKQTAVPLLESPRLLRYDLLQSLDELHIGHALPALLLDLFLQHADLALVEVGFAGQFKQLVLLGLSQRYFLFQHLLQLPDFGLVSH